MDLHCGAGGADLAAASAGVSMSPATTTVGVEQALSAILAGVLRVEQVPVDSHFFDELGADSMVMAHFCARVRKRADLPSLSMKEVYGNPTIRSLAASIIEVAPVSSPAPASPPVEAPTPVSNAQHFLCGVLQFLLGIGYSFLVIKALIRSFEWTLAGSHLGDVFLRSLLTSGAGFVVLSSVPILAKWMLIGRWKPQRIRLWSLAYVRFWFVKLLVRMNPLVAFAGTPLYVLYLRALGARIGRNVLILSPHVPVCTDLLTVGDNAILRKDSYFLCYRAHAGMIETGSVRIGRNTFVGELTVLDIDTSLGDGAQIGHSSSLHAGQSVPDGEHRQGSPARQRTAVDYRGIDPAPCGTLRRVVYSLAELLLIVLVLPALTAVVYRVLWTLAPRFGFASATQSAIDTTTPYIDVLVGSLALFFGSTLFGLFFVATVPRLLHLGFEPGKIYPLYGFHYWAQRTITRLTNIRYFLSLFGDSSYIVYYLRWIGYDLGRIVQTGSNFGSEFKHDNPFLVRIGSGTMIADGLYLINADYSSTSFRLARVTIGADNFLGNSVAYPSQGKTGDNCLLGTKVLVPLDGEQREGLGLLGSPSFEIPRTVLRDSKLAPKSAADLRRRLAAKDKHNLGTMGLFVLVHWIHSFGMLLLALTAAHHIRELGTSTALALAAELGILLRIFYYALVERAYTLFRPLRPRNCSIYDPAFWSHERYWKLVVMSSALMPFDGTPLKSLVWRLLGVRIGRRVLDDGCNITERTMATIGDDCTINMGAIIQSHSQEDGGFKSDHITIGAGCTLGVLALAHYGVTMGDGAQLGPHAFLMKGEEVPPHTQWGDNPARELRNEHPAEAPITAAALFLPQAIGLPAPNGGQPV